MDMTQEEIKEYNEKSRREFEKFSVFSSFFESKEQKWGVFFPWLLFVSGMSVPFFTDELYAMWFALVPFYAYCFSIVAASKNDDLKKSVVDVVASTCGLCIILMVIRLFVIPDSESSFAIMTKMAMFNVPGSFSSTIVLSIGRRIEF